MKCFHAIRNKSGAFAAKENTQTENIRYPLRNALKKNQGKKEGECSPPSNLLTDVDKSQPDQDSVANRKKGLTRYDQDLIEKCTFTESRCRPLSGKRKIGLASVCAAVKRSRKSDPIAGENEPSKTSTLNKLTFPNQFHEADEQKSFLRMEEFCENSETESVSSESTSMASDAKSGSSDDTCAPYDVTSVASDLSSVSSSAQLAASDVPIESGPASSDIRAVASKTGPVSCETGHVSSDIRAVATEFTAIPSRSAPSDARSSRVKTKVKRKVKKRNEFSDTNADCAAHLKMKFKYSYEDLFGKLKIENSSATDECCLRRLSGDDGETETVTRRSHRNYLCDQSSSDSKDVYEFDDEEDAVIQPLCRKSSGKSEAEPSPKSEPVEDAQQKPPEKLKLKLKIRKCYQFDGLQMRDTEPHYEVLIL